MGSEQRSLVLASRAGRQGRTPGRRAAQTPGPARSGKTTPAPGCQPDALASVHLAPRVRAPGGAWWGLLPPAPCSCAWASSLSPSAQGLATHLCHLPPGRDRLSDRGPRPQPPGPPSLLTPPTPGRTVSARPCRQSAAVPHPAPGGHLCLSTGSPCALAGSVGARPGPVRGPQQACALCLWF